MKFGVSIDTLFAWVIASLLIVIAGTDIKEKVVYDVHTYTLIAIGLVYAIVVTGLSFWQMHQTGTPIEFSKYLVLNNPITNSLLGMIAGALILEICARAGYLIARTSGRWTSPCGSPSGCSTLWSLLTGTLRRRLAMAAATTVAPRTWATPTVCPTIPAPRRTPAPPTAAALSTATLRACGITDRKSVV